MSEFNDTVPNVSESGDIHDTTKLKKSRYTFRGRDKIDLEDIITRNYLLFGIAGAIFISEFTLLDLNLIRDSALLKWTFNSLLSSVINLSLINLGMAHGRERLNTRKMNNDFGLSSCVCAYRGGDPLQVGKEVLHKGDTFVWFDFPAVSKTESGGDIVIDIEESMILQRLIIESEQKRVDSLLQNPDIKAVAIRVPKCILPSINRTKSEQIFDDKDSPTDAFKGEELLLLTKEELKDLFIKENIVFAQLIDALGDNTVKRLFTLMEKSRGSEVYERARSLLKRRLNLFLERELNTIFNGPERTSLDPLSITPAQKVQRLSRMLDNPIYGRQYRQLNTVNGAYDLHSVSHLLKLDDVDLDELLSNVRYGHHRAKISALLLDILDERKKFEGKGIGKEKGEDKEEETVDEYVKKLREKGYTIEAESRQKISVVRSLKKHTKGLLKRPIYPISTLLTAWMLMYGSELLPVFEGSSGVETGTPSIVQMYQRLRGPNIEMPFLPSMSGFGNSEQEWAIEASNDTDLNGYYITQTASHFGKQGWEPETKIDENLTDKIKNKEIRMTFPVSGEIDMMRDYLLSPFSNVEFKVPIKHGYDIKNIYIQEINGNEIDFKVLRLVDGTIVVQIKGNSILFQQVRVIVRLAPVEKPLIKASSPVLLEGVEEKRLIQERLELAREGVTSETDTPLITTRTGIHKKYSVIDPTNGQLATEMDPLRRLNIEQEMTTCDCDVCNEQVVLENAVIHPDSSVNMASGYFAGVGVSSMAGMRVDDKNTWFDIKTNVEYKWGSLRSDTRHGFSIDDLGRVFDATPMNFANDPQTQQYLQQLGRPSEGNILDQKNLLETFNSLIYAGGLLSGTIVARRMHKLLKNRKVTFNSKEAIDRVINESIPQGQMQMAYRFFSALSHSRQGLDNNEKLPINFKVTGRITFDQVCDTSNADKLRAYLDSPIHYERRAKMSRIDAGVCRLIAVMILRGV